MNYNPAVLDPAVFYSFAMAFYETDNSSQQNVGC